MVDWTGQAQDAADQIDALARQRTRVTEVLSQVEWVQRAEMPALHPVHWRSDAQRRYSEQLAELQTILDRASHSLTGAVEVIDHAVRSTWSGP